MLPKIQAQVLAICRILALQHVFPITEPCSLSTAALLALRYPGHFGEPGYNAIHFNGLVNSWIRDVTIVNSDSAIYTWGVSFSTFEVRSLNDQHIKLSIREL